MLVLPTNYVDHETYYLKRDMHLESQKCKSNIQHYICTYPRPFCWGLNPYSSVFCYCSLVDFVLLALQPELGPCRKLLVEDEVLSTRNHALTRDIAAIVRKAAGQIIRLTYLILPRPKRSTVLYSLTLNDLDHRRYRFLRCHDTVDFPTKINICHVPGVIHQQLFHPARPTNVLTWRPLLDELLTRWYRHLSA